MGIFSRNRRRKGKRTPRDSHEDPHKQVDRVIAELEEQRKSALVELRNYKLVAKQMEQDVRKQNEQAQQWEQRAMAALQAGDEELAKQALSKQRACKAEATKIRKDRDEAASYAIELNRSRKKLESRLQVLKLKKGTLATQIAAARGSSSFSEMDSLVDKLNHTEAALEEQFIQAEVEAALEGELSGVSDVSPLGNEQSQVGGKDTDMALQELKRKIKATESS